MTLRDTTDNKKYFEKLPNVVLIPWHYDNKNVRPYPYIGKREIFCGPKLQNEDSKERKFIRTSGRFFNIDEVLSRLNENDRKIDLIVSILESGKNICFPKNLGKIKCPKIALVADTHHSLYSISSIIRYIKREVFDHMLIFGQPAHLHFFYEAGIRHCAYIPRPVLKLETVNTKKPGVTFIGKRWKPTHLRRNQMLYFLEKNLPKKNIPFHRYNRLSKPNWRKVLTHSKMVVISSLNGQITPQIYNALSAGALCFADELSPQTSLYLFFEPGKHFVEWYNFEDMLEKIIYYYNHPAEAELIAKAGKFQAENNYVRNISFPHFISEFVFENKVDSRLLAINDRRCQQKRVESPEYFEARVRLYENIQEMHRIHEMLTLISITDKNLKPSADLADLQRLRITHAFLSENSKKEADLYFKNVGVNNQIITTMLEKIKNNRSYDIGILESPTNQTEWKFLVKNISGFLKSNSLLWIIGELTSFEKEILKKEGFKRYNFNKTSVMLKIKEISRNFCLLFWKLGMYPFPYLTLKPAMETTNNLNVFLRGWQANLSFIY